MVEGVSKVCGGDQFLLIVVRLKYLSRTHFIAAGYERAPLMIEEKPGYFHAVSGNRSSQIAGPLILICEQPHS